MHLGLRSGKTLRSIASQNLQTALLKALKFRTSQKLNNFGLISKAVLQNTQSGLNTEMKQPNQNITQWWFDLVSGIQSRLSNSWVGMPRSLGDEFLWFDR
jgi:hypothetical protein